jgi:CDP-glycerol glycerophosphotransferase (TagB/SpsB family)
VFLAGFNSIKINLWHGLGLKKVGHSIDSGVSNYMYSYRNFIEYGFKYLSYFDCYIRPDYLISTTLHQSEPYTKAFRIPLDKCLNFGTPRTDIFFKSNDEILSIQDLKSDKYFVQYIQKQKKYEKVLIYMPTWREDGRDFFKTIKIDFYRLDILLAKNNSLLILKLHPYTKIDSLNIDDLSNIEFYDNKIDLYPYLPFTDVLITDYSSIYYDYLLLRKQTILYLPDLEGYISNSRSFVYDFEESTAGPKSYNFEQLIDLIAALSVENKENYYKKYGIKEKNIIDLFWGDYNGDASKKLFDFISKQEL